MLPSFAGVPGAEIAVLAMAFAWGATIGSFVNVVVHRVPRRESVVYGASRCPSCGTTILPRDNIPVLGWILLRGRCRACAARISPRYPLVEAACGAVACGVAAVEIIGGGGGLPWLSSAPWQGIDRLLMHADFRLAASWALHTGALILLIAWSLLSHLPEPHHVSARTAWAAILVVLVVIIAVPEVGPPGIGVAGDVWPEAGRPAALVAAVVGGAAGWIAGRLTGRRHDSCSFAILGATLGWQTLTVVATLTAILRGAVAATCGRHDRALDPLPAVAVATVLAWGPIRTAIGRGWAWATGW